MIKNLPADAGQTLVSNWSTTTTNAGKTQENWVIHQNGHISHLKFHPLLKTKQDVDRGESQLWEGWVPKNWYFWTVVLEKTLESPLDCKEIQLVHLKEISPGCSLEGLMLKLKFQYSGHLMWRVNSLEKTLMLGKIESRRRRGWQGMRCLDGITDWLIGQESEQTSWDSEGQGSLACFSPWGCRVGHNLATEQCTSNQVK